MPKNIVLVGLMGAGKTSVGLCLEQKTGRQFLDSDNIIEKEQGCSISEIFEKNGEAFFRKLESEVILRISGYNDKIIATGGGSVQNLQNLEYLRKNGQIFYLKALPEELYIRIKSQNNRPLLQNENPQGTLKNLLKLREENYLKADIIIETSGKSVEDITEEILKVHYDNVER